MAKKYIKFTLDTIDSRYSPVGTVKQLDSVFFYIKITENGVTKDLTGQTIKLFAIKEDKKIVEQTTKINITNQSEGLVEIELLNAAIQVHGFTYFELEISDNTGIISTADFILRVNKRVASDEAIESTNEVSTLKEIEVYVAQAKQEIKEFKTLQSEMLKTNEFINNQEALREDAERKRNEAEIIREEKIEQFGSQVTNITNVALLDVYLDFPKRLKEITSNDKEFYATFDSLRVIEKNVTGSGNGGFNIQVPEGINTIEFDVEQLNFGINCGLYYFLGETLKKSYRGYSQDVSNVIKHTKGIKFEINWEEVNNTINTSGYDSLRFIVWNGNGSLLNGYNYLTNIKVNGFRKAEDVNNVVIKVEEEIKETLKKGNVGISDIKNLTSLLAETHTLTKWGSNSNMIYNEDTGIISFSYNADAGNYGFQTSIFNHIGNFLRITGEVLTFSGNGLSVSLAGKTKSGNKQVYYNIGTVNKVGIFEIECDIQALFAQREELKIDTINVVFSNSLRVSITCRNIKVISIDTLLKGKTLDDVLNGIKDESISHTDNVFNDLQIEDIKNDNIIIAKTTDLQKWTGPSTDLILNDNLLNFNHNTETGNSGAITDTFISKTNFIRVKGNTLSINKYNSGSKMQICVVGKKVSTGETTYITTNYISEIGKFDFSIDLNNLAVYKELDLAKPIQILLGSINKVSIQIKDYTVYENKLPQANLITEKLDETLLNFDQAITTINSKIEGLDSNSGTSLISPNGTKFILQVSDEGVITAIPTIPNKVLFIGNSLLLGHGTFGMCAKDGKNDYYYHVKEYLKRYNSDVICDKLLGAPWEQTETQVGIDSWIDNNINNKENNYDLVIVQLGDNVNNEIRNELFKTTCKQLLEAIRNKMNRARVVWVGEWYYTAQRQNIIAKSCAETGSTFIDITDLTTKENQGALGDIITRDDGTTFEVTSSGVASHPGNKGMKAIADRLIEKLFN